MRLLLDTHIFLWFITSDPRLPRDVAVAVRDPASDVFLSPVSLWESVVKHALGKLPLPADPHVYLPEQRRRHGIATPPLTESSVARLSSLPPLHRDPFDRLLVCQALDNNLALVTLDSTVRTYPVQLLPT
jgi:PIN domain nuclease of toxin-antitoxin system